MLTLLKKVYLFYVFTIIPEKSTTAKRISYIYLYCKGTNTTTTEPSMVHLIKLKNEIKEVVYIYMYIRSHLNLLARVLNNRRLEQNIFNLLILYLFYLFN